MNTTWNGVNEARLELPSEIDMGSYNLFVRKVIYNDTNFPAYGKWRGVQSRKNAQRAEGDPRDASNAAVFLHNLDQAYTWEIRVILKDDTNKSGTIFLDPPMLRGTGHKHEYQNKLCGNRSKIYFRSVSSDNYY